MDYFSVTRGGWGGGYRNIVLAPASVQETFDLMQLAFFLADKYRIPVVVLTDAIIGQVVELIRPKKRDFPPLPEKDWAIKGKAQHSDGGRRFITQAPGVQLESPSATFLQLWQDLSRKHQRIQDSETRYEAFQIIEDASLLLVAYGYVARVSREAVKRARAEGLRAGLIRPITLYPFPYSIIQQKAFPGNKFLVVEDSGLGQMLEDVRLAAEGRVEVHFLGTLARHDPTVAGMILPDKVVERIKELA
jgi:2-oxoglutarate ferredoxin oxidoreductase subunit alpha